MSILIAFLAGIAVSIASLVVPHSRNHANSIEEFEAFQRSLATLPITRSKNLKD